MEAKVPPNCPGKLNEANKICRDCCRDNATVYCAKSPEDNLINSRAERFGEKQREEER